MWLRLLDTLFHPAAQGFDWRKLAFGVVLVVLVRQAVRVGVAFGAVAVAADALYLPGSRQPVVELRAAGLGLVMSHGDLRRGAWRGNASAGPSSV